MVNLRIAQVEDCQLNDQSLNDHLPDHEVELLVDPGHLADREAELHQFKLQEVEVVDHEQYGDEHLLAAHEEGFDQQLLVTVLDLVDYSVDRGRVELQHVIEYLVEQQQ